MIHAFWVHTNGLFILSQIHVILNSGLTFELQINIIWLKKLWQSWLHLQAWRSYMLRVTNKYIILFLFYAPCRIYIILKFMYCHTITFEYCIKEQWPPLCLSGQSSWLKIKRSRVRFPALPDFLSSGSATGYTDPREYNWRTTLNN
jgi:hypothetical protein